MAKKNFGIGIIGTGWVATAHGPSLQQISGCRVVAICSRKKSRASQFINDHKLTDAVPYGRLSDFLKHKDLDIVMLCTPHPNHPAEAIAAARAGKHIIIEKPASLNRKDLHRMVAAVNKSGVQTSVCFELRWGGLFRNIKAFLKQGLLGNVYYGETSYFHGIGPWYGQYDWNIKKRMGGDALLTAGCHALDGLMWLIDSPVAEVAAFSNTSSKNPLKYEYDPNSVAILKFKNGAIGKVATSIECRQPYLFPVLLQGDKGTVYNDQISTLHWPGLHGDQWATIPTDLPDSGDVKDHPYLIQHEYFIDCLRNNRRPHNNLNNAAHVHEVIFAINDAIRTKKTTKIRKTPGA